MLNFVRLATFALRNAQDSAPSQCTKSFAKSFTSSVRVATKALLATMLAESAARKFLSVSGRCEATQDRIEFRSRYVTYVRNVRRAVSGQPLACGLQVRRDLGELVKCGREIFGN